MTTTLTDPPARDRILDAALRLFARKGFDGTAVPQIATAAAVATGSIYRYFASKEVLVNELYRLWKGRLLTALQRDFPVNADARTQFTHLWSVLVTFAADAPPAFGFLETHYHAPYLDAQSQALEGEVMDFARTFARAAIAAGAIRPLDPDLVIAVVFGIFVNVTDKLGEASADAETCAWNAIKAT